MNVRYIEDWTQRLTLNFKSQHNSIVDRLSDIYQKQIEIIENTRKRAKKTKIHNELSRLERC